MNFFPVRYFLGVAGWSGDTGGAQTIVFAMVKMRAGRWDFYRQIIASVHFSVLWRDRNRFRSGQFELAES